MFLGGVHCIELEGCTFLRPRTHWCQELFETLFIMVYLMGIDVIIMVGMSHIAQPALMCDIKLDVCWPCVCGVGQNSPQLGNMCQNKQ